jgi:hypothetical protein
MPATAMLGRGVGKKEKVGARETKYAEQNHRGSWYSIAHRQSIEMGFLLRRFSGSKYGRDDL